MYNEKDLIRVLKKDLKAEFDAILFYLDNLKKLNYKKNKKIIDELTLDSFNHAESIAKLMLNLQKDTKGKLSSSATRKAMVEEVGMKGLYAYEIERTEDKKVKRELKKLLKEEVEHEELVKKLK